MKITKLGGLVVRHRLSWIALVVEVAQMGCSAQTEQGEVTQSLCDNDRAPCLCPGSPIIIDLDGDGIALTPWQDGVQFGLRPGTTGSISWTAPESDDAWLVMDRDGNGAIDDGTEMFGNFTPQPAPEAGEQRNGFRALAVLDANHDGVVDSKDPAFTRLRVWRDGDHDGVSQPEELLDLRKVGILGLSVAYTPDKFVDRFGNRFAYRASVYAEPGRNVGMTAWDVWLNGTVSTRSDVAHLADEDSCGGGTTLRPDLATSLGTLDHPVFSSEAGCVMLLWSTQNIGSARAPDYDVVVYLNGERRAYGRSPALDPGQTGERYAQVCQPFRLNQVNTVDVYVNAQPSLYAPPLRGGIVEESYTNNSARSTFTAY